MEATQLKERGPGKNKRKWTEEEDAKLIEALIDLTNSGTHKADNGFKSGYSRVLENMLEVKLPGSGLKAKPHIESRIKIFKRDFNIVRDMLHGPNTSGFSWDSDCKCVIAEKPIWNAYVQIHKSAATIKNKPFIYYEELCTIFGKDLPIRKDAQTAEDVLEELDRDVAHGGTDVDRDCLDNTASLSNMQSSSEEYSSRKEKKRARISDYTVEGLKEATMILGNEVREATSWLSHCLGFDVTVADKRKMVNGELLKISGLSTMERYKAGMMIVRDHDVLDLFFSIDDGEKEEWVKALLRGDI